MSLIQEKKISRVWSWVVLAPVLVSFLGYIFFRRNFAELHITSPEVGFPVFVGEILLLWCAACFVLYTVRVGGFIRKRAWVLFFYFVWLILKVMWGVYEWGPLALRHAALFYYPFFALIGYVFYRADLFGKKISAGLFIGLLAIFAGRVFEVNWTLTLGCFAALIIIGVNTLRWRYLMTALLLLFFPYHFLFQTSRMMCLGNLAALTFILITALHFFLIPRLYKGLISGVVIIVLGVGFYFYFVQGRSGRVFPSPAAVIRMYRHWDREVQSQRSVYHMAPLNTRLYNPEEPRLPQRLAAGSPEGLVALQSPVSATASQSGFLKFMPVSENEIAPGSGIPPGSSSGFSGHNVWKLPLKPDLEEIGGVSMGNVLFRLMIWRDMLADLWTQKPLGGIDFGRPFRSFSLESLGWASGEWSRDGWIEPHNSYLNVIYRAGLLGFLLVGVFFMLLVRLIRQVWLGRSWVLLLLTAVILNWSVAANFLLILELPYTAISFWFIFGATLAYADRLRGLNSIAGRNGGSNDRLLV